MATVVWARSLGPLVVAELRHRYAESALGALWAVLVPLVEVAAYAIVFGLLLGVRLLRSVRQCYGSTDSSANNSSTVSRRRTS